MTLSVVNSVLAISTTGTNAVTTSGLNITAGNLIVVGTWNFDADSINDDVSVTDSASNTYTKIGATPQSGSFHATMWYAKNVTGGSSVTFTYNTSPAQQDFPRIAVAQVAGADTVSPLDQSAFSQNSSSGSSITSSAINTTVSNEILFAVGADTGHNLTESFGDGGGTNNTGSWTVAQSQSDNSGIEGSLAYAIVSSSGNYKVTLTISSITNNQILCFASFSAVSTPSGPVARFRWLG